MVLAMPTGLDLILGKALGFTFGGEAH